MSNELVSKAEKVNLFPNPPAGWNEVVLTDLRKLTPTAEMRDPSQIHEEANNRWKERTGKEVTNSELTVIIPIHNEANVIAGILSSLRFSDIPQGVRINYVFVTNDCTDGTPSIIQSFMSDIGEMKLTEPPLTIREIDKNISSMRVTKEGSFSYIHIDTKTKGKPNALNIGNQVASDSKNSLALSFDADVYLQPDTIPIMFGEASERITGKKYSPAIMSVVPIKEKLGTSEARYSKRSKPQVYTVFGEAMVWDVNWIQSIGGVPAVATQDYALGLIARAEDRSIDQIDSTAVWTYIPNNSKETWKTRKRFIRGKFQLRRLLENRYPSFPEVQEKLEEEMWYMRALRDRLKVYSKWIEKDGEIKRETLREIALWEVTRVQAYIDYLKNPNNQSWEQIHSSKGVRW